MKKKKQMVIWSVTGVLLLITLIFFGLGFHRPSVYIQNFEVEEYENEIPDIKPQSVVNGLAVYTVGEGEPVLLFPYPHGHTTEPMSQSDIADILVELGRKVITFDPPGAYYSTRSPDGSMEEMIKAADETLERLRIEGPIDIVGHSMGGFAALAYAIERPERTQRLILITSISGFPAAARCGFPGSAFHVFEADYWRVIFWGVRINAGRGSLALHKKLQNLMGEASFYNKAFFSPLEIDHDDENKGIPIRMIWSKNMYTGLSYADRLKEVYAPTLIIAGRHDPQASLACSDELAAGIQRADLVVFENSGHAPFIEERKLFIEVVGDFLFETQNTSANPLENNGWSKFNESPSPMPPLSTLTPGALAKANCQQNFEHRELLEPYQHFGNQPRFTLSNQELSTYIEQMGIDSLCLPEAFGAPFINADWNHLEASAHTGRMLSIGFEGQYEGSGWSRVGLVYSTYDFEAGTEYEIFASPADYAAILNDGTHDDLQVDGRGGFIRFHKGIAMGDQPIRKTYLFPGQEGYIAVYFRLGYFNPAIVNDVIESLKDESAPIDIEPMLILVDEFVKAIEFK